MSTRGNVNHLEPLFAAWYCYYTWTDRRSVVSLEMLTTHHVVFYQTAILWQLNKSKVYFKNKIFSKIIKLLHFWKMFPIFTDFFRVVSPLPSWLLLKWFLVRKASVTGTGESTNPWLGFLFHRKLNFMVGHLLNTSKHPTACKQKWQNVIHRFNSNTWQPTSSMKLWFYTHLSFHNCLPGGLLFICHFTQFLKRDLIVTFS